MKRIVSILLSIVILTSCVVLYPNCVEASGFVYNEEYPYAIFASSIEIKANSSFINGLIYDESKEKQNIKILDKNFSIIVDYIYSNCLSDNEPVFSDGCVYVNEDFNYSIGSLKNIDINWDTINTGNIALYSRDGDIEINCNSLCYNGIIYAPNGSVNIVGENINLNAVIIAESVKINAESLNIKKNEFVAKYLGNISDIYSEQKDDIVFNRDVFGNISNITSNDVVLVNYIYEDSFTKQLLRIEYGNGSIVECTGDETISENANINQYVISSREAITSDYSYSYDKNFNITAVTTADGNNTLYKYEYEDERLVKAIDLLDNVTYIYQYDNRGNIIKKNKIEMNETGNICNISKNNYVYDSLWKDRLVDDGMYLYEYDEIGNPVKYKNWVFEWDNGRQLKSASNQDTNIEYKYNSDGIRTSKNLNGQETKFVYAGKKIVEQHDKNDIIFTYDSNIELEGVIINGEKYSYVKNPDGDIEKIIDTNNNIVVEYEYDPYGDVISVTGELANSIGEINPIRYRGYYYDNETELYYLQTRYYDPQNGRFINSDDFCLVEDNTSMYMYCNGNPVRYIDDDGMFAWDPKLPTINSQSDYEYFVNVWLPAHPEYYFGSFAKKLGEYESSNNYSKVNQYGYLGYWQLGKLALQDLGYKDSNGKWTTAAAVYKVYSDSDFLGNPNAQDKIFVEHCKKQWKYIKSYGLNAYVGKTWEGIKVTDSGLLAAVHLVGAYGMKQALIDGKPMSDGNGTKPQDYMKNISGLNVEYIKK